MYGERSTGFHSLFTSTSQAGYESVNRLWSASGHMSRYGTNNPHPPRGVVKRTPVAKIRVLKLCRRVKGYKAPKPYAGKNRAKASRAKQQKPKRVWEYYTKEKWIYPPRRAKDPRPKKKYGRNASGFTRPNMLHYWEGKILSTWRGRSIGVYPGIPSFRREIYGDFGSGLAPSHILWGGYETIGDQPNVRDPSGLAGPFLEELTERSLNKLYSKLKNQEVNMGNVLAEAGKTVEGMAALVARLAQIIRELKARNYRGALRLLGIAAPNGHKTGIDELSDIILQIQYGIRPLLQDLIGFAHWAGTWTASEGGSKSPPTFTVSGVSAVHMTPNSTRRVVSQFCKGDITMSHEYDVIVKMTATCSVRSAVDVQFERSLTELGLLNLGAIAWEMTPWSFVLDWLIPIGSWINNLDAIASLKIESVHQTVIVKERLSSVTQLGGVDSTGIHWSPAESGWVTQNYSCVRVPLEEIPPLPLPRFKNPISTEHLVNAAALITQLLKK